MSSGNWDLPGDVLRILGQPGKEALRQIHLLEGERIQRVWKTGAGFLVMTNLRCTELSHKPRVFVPRDWEEGPSFFFYNLAPPRVELHRFLRLSEDSSERPTVLRCVVHDPYTVAQEIEAARHAGMDEWLRRRARAEASIRRSQERWRSARASASADEARRMARVRCGYCGNLLDRNERHCPFCGAPLP